MNLSTRQTQQLALILSCIFEEIRSRPQNYMAVSELAYASHNLPFLGLNDHHSLTGFQTRFEQYHRDHGYLIFKFDAMLETLAKDEEPVASPNLAANQRDN